MPISDEKFLSNLNQRWLEEIFVNHLYWFYKLGFYFPEEGCYQSQYDKSKMFEEQLRIKEQVCRKVRLMYNHFEKSTIEDIESAFMRTLDLANEEGKKLRWAKLPLYELRSY
ncbi:hypothetical protein [Alkaliphilus hydrothermalis]|uniref:hypothetical protein n=1 Tax=Alkaliphilus hydrothermalis TaxID=1482730 RepID=UPI00195C8E07|nr:hypothetical protein [Alkaliphilus hydrothermalis]